MKDVVKEKQERIFEMDEVLLDTDILSYYLKGNTNVIDEVGMYLRKHNHLKISTITYYEILSGLEAKGAKQQIKLFKKFAKENEVVNLSENSLAVSASAYGKLKREGNLLDDIDLLIAGIAISNNLVLVTNNQKHFGRIEGLKTLNWVRL